VGVVGGRVGEAVEPVTVQPGTVTAARSAWCSGNGTVTASIDGAPHAATSCWSRPARPSTAASPWPGAGLRKIGRRGYRRWRLLGGQVAAQKTVGSASTTRASAVPVAATLVAVAAGCWWGTLRAPMMTAATLPAFLVAWLAMMAAMMMPAVAPAVRLYLRASARTAAPAPWFVGGYLAVWTAVGVPAYFAWRLLAPAGMAGRPEPPCSSPPATSSARLRTPACPAAAQIVAPASSAGRSASKPSSLPPRVGNFDEQPWGDSLSGITCAPPS